MKKIKEVLYYLLHGGLTDVELKMCTPEIRKRNVSVLGWLLPLLICGLFALFIVSYVPGSGEESNRNLYLVFTVFFAVQHVMFRLFFKKDSSRILVMSYFSLLTLYAFGIYEAIWLGADTTSTTFCVLLITAPMLICDLPIRLIVLTVLSEGFLLCADAIVGNTQGDQFVVLNTLACTVISVFCCYSIQRTKLSDIRNHLLLEKQRDTDVLTGAHSRVAYSRDIDVMVDKGMSAGIIFADVNGLKKVNDTWGHEAGDRLIRNAYQMLRKHFGKDHDCIYRIGGDEFVIMSVGEESDTFRVRFEALEQDLKETDMISCGYAIVDRLKDTGAAIKEAEQEMYAAKERYYQRHPDTTRRKQ